MVSNFLINNSLSNDYKKEYLSWLELNFHRFSVFNDLLENILYVEDFYGLKLENLQEDYLKLPIIKDTIPYRTNKLNDLFKIKINSQNYQNGLNYKDFYDKKTSDFIFYNFVNYFRIFDYDKNSWR